MTAKFDFASFHRSAQRREQISATDSRATVFLNALRCRGQCKKPMDSQSKRCSILLDVAGMGWAFDFGNAGLG